MRCQEHRQRHRFIGHLKSEQHIEIKGRLTRCRLNSWWSINYSSSSCVISLGQTLEANWWTSSWKLVIEVSIERKLGSTIVDTRTNFISSGTSPVTEFWKNKWSFSWSIIHKCIIITGEARQSAKCLKVQAKEVSSTFTKGQSWNS